MKLAVPRCATVSICVQAGFPRQVSMVKFSVRVYTGGTQAKTNRTGDRNDKCHKNGSSY